MRFTWYGANSWLLELSGQRILLDPWLVGLLEFGGLSWLFRATRATSIPIPEDIDLILLSQGLEDHAHPETLQALSKSIPVVGSPKAAKLCRKLGFQQVNPLEFGQTFILADRLQIMAVEGALTGMKPENGYVVTLQDTGAKLYYEPHGFFPDSLKLQAPVDVVIGPIVNLELPLAGAIVRGADSAIALVEMLKPQYFLRSTAGDDGVQFEGALNSLLKAKGDLATLEAAIHERGLKTQVLAPSVNKPIDLSLAQPVT